MIVLRGYRENRRRARVRAQRGVPGTYGGPWHWFWWAVLDELDASGVAARVAFDERVPLPAALDVAVSRWVLRLRARRWPHAFVGQQLPVPQACRPCEARWHAGRCIRHERCGQEIQLVAERHVYGARSRSELIDHLGFTPAEVERILSS